MGVSVLRVSHRPLCSLFLSHPLFPPFPKRVGGRVRVRVRFKERVRGGVRVRVGVRVTLPLHKAPNY